MRIGFLDLAESPVFHLEDNQANIFAVEQKIRFVPVDIRRVPAEVVRIRLGHPLEELVESLFPLRPKLLNISGYHRRHGHLFKTLGYLHSLMNQSQFH